MDLSKFLNPALIWALVGLGLLLSEFAIPGLVVFFFGIGALVVALVCVFAKISLDAQLIIFIVASVALLLSLRRWLTSIFRGFGASKEDPSSDLEEFIGKRGSVVRAISPGTAGKIEFRGTEWRAESDEEIPEGGAVEILSKESLTLRVKKV